MIDDATFERRTLNAITAATDAIQELYAEAVGARCEAKRSLAGTIVGEAYLKITRLRKALAATYDVHRHVECLRRDTRVA